MLASTGEVKVRPPMSTPKISADQVQAFVYRYWRVLAEKLAGEMEKLYTYDATVFNPFSQRMEPGRVSAARKEREYFAPSTVFRAEITGPIEVSMPSDGIAVASYTFRWHAAGMAEHIVGKEFSKAVRNGRATQVLVMDFEGKLRIVHEHLSDIWQDSAQLAD